jgi:sterol desaturase/sphingolipid hydroxylase (fatty acid hydroxylase superfamily)
MTFSQALEPGLVSILLILAAMGAVALLELAIPLRARGPAARAHLGPNLALTFLTFATNAVMNAALVLGLVWCEAEGFGVLRALGLPPLWAAGVAFVALDLSTYATHVAMHKLPAWWRFHSVHHSDPMLDVTTTVRQHPGESVIRYASLAVFSLALGASPVAFAVYRVAVALTALLEHANLWAPRAVDRALSWLVTFPHMHKLHHSRRPAETDSNYGNIFSAWDRLFGTYTPSERGTTVDYGLDGFDDPRTQTTVALLLAPFSGLGEVEREERA